MTESGRQYKIPRVADEFGLDRIEEELVARRTREDDRSSLRELAALFNRRLLRTVMEDAGMDPLENEVENVYRLLTDDDVSSGVRTETRKKLEGNGVEPDRVESSFVTYQAVRTYLREERGLDGDADRPDDSERIQAVEESVNRLQSRTVTVTEEKLSRLRRTDRVSLGEFRVLLNLRVFCEDCGTQYELGELFERGACECSAEAAQPE